jgi:hypothetical protein
MDPTRGKALLVVMVVLGLAFLARSYAAAASAGKPPEGIDRKQVDRGRYISTIGGCND